MGDPQATEQIFGVISVHYHSRTGALTFPTGALSFPGIGLKIFLKHVVKVFLEM